MGPGFSTRTHQECSHDAPHQSAVSVLVQAVLSDPDLAHDEVFRRLPQTGLQDLTDAPGSDVIGAGPQ